MSHALPQEAHVLQGLDGEPEKDGELEFLLLKNPYRFTSSLRILDKVCKLFAEIEPSYQLDERRDEDEISNDKKDAKHDLLEGFQRAEIDSIQP
jgi:hypothetical protein